MALRLGVVPYLDPLGGGTYQHSLNVLAALAPRRDDVVVLYREPEGARLRQAGWDARPLAPGRLARERALRALGPVRGWLRAMRGDPPQPVAGPGVRDDPAGRARLRAAGIDLMLFPTLDPLAFEAGLPFVATVLDLQIQLQPSWPENVAQSAVWAYLMRHTVRWATLLLVDSEVGREDLLSLYGDVVEPDRIRILPFLPASYLPRTVSHQELAAIRARFGLPESYLFYPAQFWPHKNHARLVRALARVRLRVPEVALVLAGGHAGELRESTFADVRGAVRDLGLEQAVHVLGFVEDEAIGGLYAGARALVFPTFFGPTNLPVPEAWSLGCPVLTSDLRGIREQCGDAALLVDPGSEDALADGMHRIWTDGELRERLVTAGRRRLATYTREDFRARLDAIITEAEARVGDGRSPRRC